nr:putative reverse transcriptase domain-containing protein [Tanacetum cinerariifolium]
MMTDKYCPRGKIKKLETKMWELKTKDTDVIGYSRRFQELALMCDRIFLEESDRVEKYIGGLPDMIHDSVKATRPKTMQEAIEFAVELMDKRIRDVVENKQKFKGTSRNNQNHPQQNKRQNTGTFLLNNRYAYILFDTGADRSFVSTTFSSQIDITPIALDHHYNIEIANGRIIRLNTIMRDCTLNFVNHPFNIDLRPVKLGSFDVIIGMDWLSRYNAIIACAEKLMRIPSGNEILTIRGEGSNERNESRLNIISCSKAQEYMSKGCHVFLANIISTKDEYKSKGKRLEDVPVVREFPEVFPEDLLGIPSTRQVEFRIDLVPGAAPVARAPYRLAPSETKELADQLQELTDKGFIRPSSLPWGALDEKEHEEHLRQILKLLKKEELYAKFSKCEFWIPNVQFLGHVIDSQGIHVDLTKIESIKD